MWSVLVNARDRRNAVLQSHCTNSYLMDYGCKIAFYFSYKTPKRMKNWYKALKITVKKGDK